MALEWTEVNTIDGGPCLPWPWLETRGKECLIVLQKHPHYCDRGNWVATLHPEGRLILEIDAADAWPRYYFDLDRAKAEIEAWLIKRKQVTE